jgi:hypothetical protein
VVDAEGVAGVLPADTVGAFGNDRRGEHVLDEPGELDGVAGEQTAVAGSTRTGGHEAPGEVGDDAGRAGERRCAIAAGPNVAGGGGSGFMPSSQERGGDAVTPQFATCGQLLRTGRCACTPHFPTPPARTPDPGAELVCRASEERERADVTRMRASGRAWRPLR